MDLEVRHIPSVRGVAIHVPVPSPTKHKRLAIGAEDVVFGWNGEAKFAHAQESVSGLLLLLRRQKFVVRPVIRRGEQIHSKSRHVVVSRVTKPNFRVALCLRLSLSRSTSCRVEDLEINLLNQPIDEDLQARQELSSRGKRGFRKTVSHDSSP